MADDSRSSSTLSREPDSANEHVNGKEKKCRISFPIHHLVVPLENADQNPVRAKSPDGVYRDGWLAHVLRHVEHSSGFRGSS